MNEKVKQRMRAERLLIVLKTLFLTLIPLFIKMALDGDLVVSFEQLTIWSAALLLGLFVTETLYQSVSSKRKSLFSANTKKNLVASIFRMPRSAFRKQKGEEWVSFVENDTEVVLEEYWNAKLMQVQNYASLFLSLGFLAVANWVLVFPMGFFLWINYCAGKYIDFDLEEVMAKRQESKEKYYAVIGNLLSCRSLIHSGNIAHILKGFHEFSFQKMLSAIFQYGKERTKMIAVFNLLLQANKLIAIILLALLFQRGRIAVGTALLFYHYLDKLIYVLSDIFAVRAGVRAAEEILRKQREVEERPAPVFRCEPIDSMTLVHAGTEYLNRTFDLTFERGTSTLIVGDIGKGKSTLLHLLTQNVELFEGEYFINGKKVDDASDSYEEQMTFMTQTDASNIEWYKDTFSEHPEEFRAFCREYRVPYKTEEFHDMSSGERQKCTVFHHLNADASVRLFDEPFSNLDDFSKEALCRAMTDAAEDTITIVIAHNATESMKRMFDRIVEL